MYGKIGKAVHCDHYHKFDDSFLNPQLSTDYESFDFSWYYYKKWYNKLQLLLKSLNTPADLLSQLPQSIPLILRLYACATSTILIASVQRP